MRDMPMTERKLDYYRNLPYTFIIEWSDIDECFLGSIAELERNIDLRANS